MVSNIACDIVIASQTDIEVAAELTGNFHRCHLVLTKNPFDNMSLIESYNFENCSLGKTA